MSGRTTGVLGRRPATAILFDALGTLVALEPPAPLLARELAARFGAEVTPAQAEQAIAAEIGYYRAHLDEGRDPASVAALRRRCAEVLRAELPCTGELAGVDVEAFTQALLAALRFTAFADAKPALAGARARGQRLVVVSNWDVSLHALLERLALMPLLNGVITSAEAGMRKPSPGIFAQALRLAHAGPGEAIHVGDSLEEDVTGARNAGLEAILLRRDGSPGPSGVRTITSLAEL